jgi:hypothetical protein
MSGESLIHITIYLKNENSKDGTDKYVPGYEISEGENDQILFSPHIFPKAFLDWCMDGEHIVNVSPLDIRTRLTALQHTHTVTPYVESKINRIITYIENNIEQYIGVALVF